MKRMIFLGYFLFFTLLTACVKEIDQESAITVYNNSDYDISYYLGSGGGDLLSVFPDTMPPLVRWFDSKVDKGSFDRYYYASLKSIYKSNRTDTLCFFIFATDTLEKYDWDVIRDEYKVLQRYDLSLQDFKRLKNKIYYPPTDEMKNMKMYPPYRKE